MTKQELIKPNNKNYKMQLGMHKPSALCQVIYFDDYKKGLFAYLNSTEIDLINLILYKAREHIITNNIDLKSQGCILDMNLNEISGIFDKYVSTGYETLIDYFRNIRSKEIVINALHKDKHLELTYTSLIHKVKVSKHCNSKYKKISLELDSEIVSLMLDVKKFFTNMFLKIQFSMETKYAKLLYELLRDYLGKDYNGVKIKIIELDLLLGLLNVQNLDRYSQFSYFNAEILKKAIKEINEKSDISVAYEVIKERPSPTDRLQVTKIKFFMEKQSDDRLAELGILDDNINRNKHHIKSKSKLESLIKKGYQVFDEDMWIETDIIKNEAIYDAESKIDDWIIKTDEEDQQAIFKLIPQLIDTGIDPTVYLDNYIIKGIFTNNIFTMNAIDSVNILNDAIDMFHENES